eukprot:scaffold4961_cov80-Cylindrotheca_fusiformis.AAC.1
MNSILTPIASVFSCPTTYPSKTAKPSIMTSKTSSASYALLSGEEAVAVPDGGDKSPTKPPGFLEQLLGPQKGRENHLYFGCCCDVRRAVLILNIITICCNLFTMIYLAFDAHIVQDDPSFVYETDVSHPAEPICIYEIVLLISCVMHAFGVSGALKYNTTHVKIAAVSYAIPLTWAAVGWAVLNFDFVPFVARAIFLYPHIVLIKEIERGVMTSYNNENIQACCAC